MPFKGELLAKVPQLVMEDWELAYKAKFPHFESIKYLKMVYYEESGVTRVEKMNWTDGIEHINLLNMLVVPHFGHKNINTVCVCLLLALVHNGALWLEERIPIDDMLIKRITTLPCVGEDHVKDFADKYEEKKLSH